MKVTFYHRKQPENMFSIENLFTVIRDAMPADIESKVVQSRYSCGFFKRVYNIFEAYFKQSDINHITGDVHYLAYLLNKNKTLLTIHDCVVLSRLTGLKQKIFLFLWYWLPIKRSTLVTVISESTKKELLGYLNINTEKIRVVPDCISPAFIPCPKVWNETKPVLLQVGTKENKNLPRVAVALSGITCHLRIIGKLSSEQMNVLKRNRIEYSAEAGVSNEQLVKEYRDADLVIFVSTYEGFGLPILEGQATGRPVLTSNIFSMPEVSGNGACIVDPLCTKSIRTGIEKIFFDVDYRNMLIENGYKNVARFGPKDVARKYVTIYNEMAIRLFFGEQD